MRARNLGFLALLGFSCGGSSSPFLPGFNPPPPPAGGIQIVTPIWPDMPPGADDEVCTWTDKIITQDVDVASLWVYQSTSGHHVAVFTTQVQLPPGTTRLCRDTDMVNFRIIGGGAGTAGGGATLLENVPPGVVFRIPAGSQLVINHHYLNATDAPVDGQTAVNVLLNPASSSATVAHLFAINDSTFDVPVGTGTYTSTTDCPVQSEVKAWFFAPHMHEFGRHVNVTLTHAGTPTTLIDTDWIPSMAFHPNADYYTTQAPLLFEPGDDVRLSCTWTNTTSSDIHFPREMCLGIAFTLGGSGDISCANGVWN